MEELTEKQKKALKDAIGILIDADLLDLSFLHIGLNRSGVKKNLKSDRQGLTDEHCPKQQ